MKKLLIVALAAALPSLAAFSVQAQDQNAGAASAPKATKQERKDAKVKRQAEMKSSMKKGDVPNADLAGSEAKAAAGAASSAERKAARKKRRAEMTESVKKKEIPDSGLVGSGSK
jgi:hypothetical protein